MALISGLAGVRGTRGGPYVHTPWVSTPLAFAVREARLARERADLDGVLRVEALAPQPLGLPVLGMLAPGDVRLLGLELDEGEPLAVSGGRRAITKKYSQTRRFLTCVAVPIFFTFLIAGIWHGAGWTFVVFGLIHGLAMATNHAWRQSGAPELPAPLGWLLTMSVVIIGLVFFRAQDVTTAEVLAASKGNPSQLVDVRDPELYLGLTYHPLFVEPHAKGHIPRAKNVPIALFANSMGPAANFYPDTSLREVATLLDVRAVGPTIVYCETGGQASIAWFVFHELLGNKEAKLYDGSMNEWSRDPRRAVVAMKIE